MGSTRSSCAEGTGPDWCAPQVAEHLEGTYRVPLLALAGGHSVPLLGPAGPCIPWGLPEGEAHEALWDLGDPPWGPRYRGFTWDQAPPHRATSSQDKMSFEDP